LPFVHTVPRARLTITQEFEHFSCTVDNVVNYYSVLFPSPVTFQQF